LETADIGTWLADYHRVDAAVLEPHLYRFDQLRAAQHMMRVAAGLDSLVLGEPQIIGQVKSAFAAAHHATAQAKKGATKVPTGEYHEYACALCADGGDLLLCEGTCMRSFHVKCLRDSGVEVPEDDEAPFYCEQCQNQSHVCSHCGVSGTPTDPTMRCSMHTCGLHFHLRCVKMLFKYR